LELCQKKGARLFCQGDIQQIASIEAGNALRDCLDGTPTMRTKLEEIRRQKNETYRRAVMTLRKSPADGLRKLVDMGAVHEVPSPVELTEQLASAYFEESDVVRGKSRQSVLIVAGTHHVISQVTAAIRRERIRRGEINPENEIARDVLESTQWTDAQRSLAREYKDKFVVQFRQNFDKRFPRGASADVVGVSTHKNEITVRNSETGEMAILDPSKISKDCDVFRVKTVLVSPGDKILFTANKKLTGKHKAVNGEIAVVESVDASGNIRLNDGRVLKESFRNWTLGYCSTVFKAQGKNIDSVVVAPDGMNRELFMVAVSRGKFSIQLFTKSLLRLQNEIQISGARTSAMSFARDFAKQVTYDKQRRLAVTAAQKAAMRVAKHVQVVESLKGKLSPGIPPTSRRVNQK
ncbi:MAG: AAA family ATPase, partial [Chthoniobacterales bacterium]